MNNLYDQETNAVEILRPTLKRGRLWATAAAIGCVWLGAAMPAPAQVSVNNSDVPVQVRPAKKTLSRDQVLAGLDPELRIKLDPKAAEKPKATAEVPLYMQAPPDQVIVAEINKGEYELTRQELEAMTTARFGEIKEGLNPWVLADLQRKRDDMMTQVLQEWLAVKVITELAYKAKLTVTPEEIQARMSEISQQTGAANLQQVLANQAAMVGIESKKMQKDIQDALIVDKFILNEVNANFPEAKLHSIYDADPSRYMAPLRVHAWQVFRRTDPDLMSKKEIKDIRSEMYSLSTSLGKAKDKIKAFQEAAAKVSEDPLSKDRGGDMGWVDSTASLTPEIANAVFVKLKPGQVSGLIETHLGYAVVMVSERQEPQGRTFDAYARKAVVDDLVSHYKTEVGPKLVLSHPELNICSNASGYRLKGQEAVPQPKRTPPPDRAPLTADAGATPVVTPSPTPLVASRTLIRPTAPPMTPAPRMTAPPMTTPRMTAPPMTTPRMTAPPMTTPRMTAPPMTAPRMTAPPMTTPRPSPLATPDSGALVQ